MSKLICFLGPPASGKSTLASSVHTDLKKSGQNSIFVGEVATNYIAEYGIPNRPLDQMVIFYKQLNAERMFVGNKDIIVCDSSSILNYFYFRGLFSGQLENKDIAAINHMQKEILRSLNQWHRIYYVPPIQTDVEDGIRYHDRDQINAIDSMIKGYLIMENIPYHDLSTIDIKDRTEYVVKDLSLA